METSKGQWRVVSQRAGVRSQEPAYCLVPTAYGSMDCADPLSRSAVLPVRPWILALKILSHR